MKGNNEGVPPAKRAKLFCPNSFRKELKGNEALKSLKKFISAVSNENEDVIMEYLKIGGSIMEVLSLIDTTAKGDLTTALPVFEVVQLIFLRFQSRNSEYYHHCLDGAKHLLSHYHITLQSLLSMNIAKHKKVALKLLTSIVTLQSSLAFEVLNMFSPSVMPLKDLVAPSSEKESVRKYFILFILSFVIDGSVPALKIIMESKGFLGLIIPGLKHDDAATVNMTLSMLESKILKNIKIPKTLKLKTFNTQIVKSLFELFDWKGPHSVDKHFPGKRKKHKIIETNQNEKESVIDSVHSFLITLCTSKKYGISFSDKSSGLSDTTNNQLLLSVLEGISNPLGNAKMRDVFLKILINCPDLVKPALIKLEPFFQPRSSHNWVEAVEFAENLIKSLDVVSVVKAEAGESANVQRGVKVVRNFCFPVSLLRTAKAGSEQTQPLDVRLRSLRLLFSMWTSAQKVVKVFKDGEQALKKAILDLMIKFLPEIEETIALWHSISCKNHLTATGTSDLRVVLKILQILLEGLHEGRTKVLSLVSDIIQSLESAKEALADDEYNELRVDVLNIAEMNLDSLSPDTEVFKSCLIISLQTSESCARKILSNLNVFQKNAGEIDVWLTCFFDLSEEHQKHVSHFLVDAVRSFTLYKEEDELSSQESEDNEPSPLIFHCLNLTESYNENEHFKLYLQKVVINLQRFYPVTLVLFEKLKGMKRTLGENVIHYLKCWTTNSKPCLDSLEQCLDSQENALENYLLAKGDNRRVNEILTDQIKVSKLRSLFHIVLGYLVTKTSHGHLTHGDLRKLENVFSFLFSQQAPSVSVDLENVETFQKDCAEKIFKSRVLLKAFNVFSERKSCEFRLSTLIANVLMSNEKFISIIKRDKGMIVNEWKKKFLKALKKKLKKREPLHPTEHLKTVLNFFEYCQEEVEEMVDSFVKDSDLTLYLVNGEPSEWATVCLKFALLHGLAKRSSDDLMRKLCLLMKFFHEANSSDLRALDECLVSVLREHPKNLEAIDNGFIEILLNRKHTNESTLTLAKLLLNDPLKSKHFLAVAPALAANKKNIHLVYSLLMCLLIEGDPFLEAIKSDNICIVWKASDVSKVQSPEFFDCLQKIYCVTEELIVRALNGESEPFVQTNLLLLKIMVRLFAGKELLKPIKKKIRRGHFEAELMAEIMAKFKEGPTAIIFLQGLLIKFSELLAKESKDGFEASAIWEKYHSVVLEIVPLISKIDCESIVKSPDWKNFYAAALGLCFKAKKDCYLLKILRVLINAVYQPAENFKDEYALNFQMLISHSQFLNAIFSDSNLKEDLLGLFYILVVGNPNEMSSKHIPILLASYSASMNETDKTIVKILKLYEEKGLTFGDYEPLVWGETAISHYSIGSGTGLSLWRRFTMANVLDLLDFQRVQISLKEFPIHRTMQLNDGSKSDCDDDIYDPAFLLPLLANLLSPGSVVFSLAFVYKGALAYTIRGLSSECVHIRGLSSLVLSRFYNHLELNKNSKQKFVWIHFIDCLRYGIDGLSNEPLPNVITHFFAKMTLELSAQSSEMQSPLQSFLLAKPFFSFKAIPEFLPLFHSSQVFFWQHRIWLLSTLKDAIKTTADVKVIFYSMAMKVLFCYFHSPFGDLELNRLILQVAERLVDVQETGLLISEYGLLSWVNSIDFGSCTPLLGDVLKLLDTCTRVIAARIRFSKNKQSGFSDLVQILNILTRLLPSVKKRKVRDEWSAYLKIFNDSLLMFHYENHGHDWFAANKGEINALVDAGLDLCGADVRKFGQIPFYFRDHDDNDKNYILRNFKNSVFLFNKLINCY